MPTPFPASCFCRAIEFSLTAPPMFIHACHCTDCQAQTGGAFVVNGIIEARHVVQTHGPAPVCVTMLTDSGRPHDIYRCPTCATALWSDYGRRKVMLFVRMMTLKEAHRFTPDVHIFTRSKVPWLVLPGEGAIGATTGRAPGVFEEYYDMAQEWPAESLQRRAALLAKAP